MDEKSTHGESIGSCAYCGSEELTYGAIEFSDGNMIYYPFTCDECGAEGKEWYEMTYSCTEMVNLDN